MIGVRNQVSPYKVFVEAGLEEVTEQFYGKKKQATIFGTESYVEGVSQGVQSNREYTDAPLKPVDIDIDTVIQAAIAV